MYLDTRASEHTGSHYNGTTMPLGSRGVAVVVTNSVFVFLVTVWTGLRFYSRKNMGHGLMIEDYFFLGAVISFFGLSAVSILMVLVGGFGHHISELDKSIILRCLRLGFASQILYTTTLALIKISICSMLTRIFQAPAFKLAARILVGFVCCWTLMAYLVAFLICHPVEMNWNPLVPNGKCGDQVTAFASIGIVDVVTDLLILLLPIPMVWKLELPKANKIALLVIFCMGILTMIFGLARVAILLDVSFKDFTYTGKTLHILTISEAAVSIMVASSPMLRPIFDRIWRISISSFGYSGVSTKYSVRNSAGISNSSRPISPRTFTGTFRSSLKSKAQGFSVIEGDIILTPVAVNQFVTKIEASPGPIS